ncbi:Lrp/AsnC family transcriptional regulator [Candidatus Woesearchaeota archaeon]|nr:Lrp/AsnC family transcriptional regulator [Candidatus Woesearchaeota archaeon]
MTAKSHFGILGRDSGLLDKANKKIIAELLKDSRQSFVGLGKSVNLSKDSVQYRDRKLLDSNVILSSYVNIDFEKLGYYRYHLLLLLDETKQNRKNDLIENLVKDPNVLKATEFNASWDLEVVVVAKDVRDFDLIVGRLLDPFADMIRRKDTEAEIKTMNQYSVVDKMFEGAKCDKIDMNILRLLSENARVSTYKIGAEIGFRADAVRLRILKMRKSGVIKGFTIRLNLAELKYLSFVFSFTTASLPSKEESRLFTHLAQSPYTMTVKKLVGEWDFKYYLAVKSLDEYHNLIKDLKKSFPDYIQEYRSMIVYKEHVFDACPMALLED